MALGGVGPLDSHEHIRAANKNCSTFGGVQIFFGKIGIYFLSHFICKKMFFFSPPPRVSR